MGAPSSGADICNLASDLVMQTNETPVTSISSPNSSLEVVCARWYDTVRRSLLRSMTWRFATKRTQLTPDITPPAFQYTAAFNVPNDFLRLSWVQDDFWEIDKEYGFENNQILTYGTSNSTLNLVYVYDFTNVGRMDSMFVDLLAHQLAVRISYKTTASNSTRQALKELRDDLMIAAKQINGQERPPIRIERSTALNRRRLAAINQVWRNQD